MLPGAELENSCVLHSKSLGFMAEAETRINDINTPMTCTDVRAPSSGSCGEGTASSALRS